MYKAESSYRSGGSGLLFFLPGCGDRECDLRVTFTPKAYYPAERDCGAGPDFDADIRSIELRDYDDGDDEKAWHALTGNDLWAARCFLENHYKRPMWDQAFDETAEAFGVDDDMRVAA